MKTNKITGLILLIISALTIVIYFLTFLNQELSTKFFIYDCFVFLIVGFIWFISLFFIKKEEGNKLKIFLKMIGKLLLIFVILALIMLFIK